MNSIQRRSNPFQLCQRTPRQNLQARMKFFDIFGYKGQVILETIITIPVYDPKQMQLLSIKPCYSSILKLQYSEIYSRRPWKREEKVFQFSLALSEYICLKSSPIFSYPWGVKLAPSVLDNMKSWDLYEWTQKEWTREKNSQTFWPKLISNHAAQHLRLGAICVIERRKVPF